MISGASSATSRVRRFIGRNRFSPVRSSVLQTKCTLPSANWDRLPFDPDIDIIPLEHEPLADNRDNGFGPETSDLFQHRDSGYNPARDLRVPPEAVRKHLLPILRLLGCADDIPKPKKGSTNLGYTNLRNPLNRALRRESLNKNNPNTLDGISIQAPPENRGISCAGLTARYILYKIWPDREELYQQGYPLRRIFFALGERALKYIATRNADPGDIALWAHVVLASSGAEATARLSWLCRKLKFRVPSFIFNHTLRHLSGHTIHTIKSLASLVDTYLTRNVEIADFTSKPDFKIDALTKRIMFLRLFRLANYFAPTQLPYVAKIYAKHCIEAPATITMNDIIFCNHILWAIGGPPRIPTPYWTSLRYIIDAQIFLLRKMFQANPVMHLDPKGFRGIVRTRLAAPRSVAERGMIAHQGESWPPRKDITDGYDQTHSRIDFDNETPAVSEAGQVLSEMQRAGYPLGTWERSAMILSGRESDGTPTVPRRTWFIAGTSTGEENPFTLWQARIRATRTLNEAWHIFLKFLDSIVTTSQERAGAVHVYQELFERVIQDRKQEALDKHPKVEEPPLILPLRTGIQRFIPPSEELDVIYAPPKPKKDPTEHYLRLSDTTIRGPTSIRRGPNLEDRATVSIGNTKNIIPPPSDPSRGAFVPTPAPSVSELWALMLRNGIKPSLSLTKLLVSNAATPNEAEIYLNEWYIYPRRRKTFKTEKGKVEFRWWEVFHRKELEKLRIRQFGVQSPDIKGEKETEYIDASSATVDLAISYIHCLTSTTFAPRKNRTFLNHWNFSSSLLFLRVPQAIIIASGFGITSLSAWTSILKALNYTHHHRGLFQSELAKYGTSRLASARFGEGNPRRKMKYRDVNVCVKKIWEHVRLHWGFPLEANIVYEFTIAAERGWEYEQQLKAYTNDQTHHHERLPFRTTDVIEMFETVVGIRQANEKSFKNPGDRGWRRIAVGHSNPTSHRRLFREENDGFTVPKPDGSSGGDEDIIFDKLVELSSPIADEKSRLPPPVTPRTAHLHAYIRLLLRTAEGEYEPILRLLKWMGRYSDFLEVKNRRLTIIAMKAMWDFNTGLADMHPDEKLRVWEARKAKYAEAKRLFLERLKGWGSWPTDLEVAAYNGENWRELRDQTPGEGEKDEDEWEEEGFEERLQEAEAEYDMYKS
ncbi:hypothetical protein TWF730_000650 [Orbilia blumenaviensis]|uniref:Uncharacterized protein n=1 Tax=Orbilia blumenaviensis TaxID=1796055 RepID=A0AAV9VMK6_9PEZI